MYANNLRTVLSDATVDRETSFFLEAMRECYDTCIEDSGTSRTAFDARNSSNVI